MKIVKGVLNVLGVLAAFLLSLLLAAVLFCTPVVSATSALMQTDTIRTMLKEIDFSEIFVSEGDGSDYLEGVDAETVDALVGSTMLQETIDLYVEGVFAVIEGKAEKIEITAEQINAIGQEHLDELMPIVEAMVEAEMKEQIDSGQLEGEIEIPEEQLREIAGEMVSACAEGIAQALPTESDLGLDATVVQGIAMLRNGMVLGSLIAAAAVLSVLILLCRFMRFKGFMWLGVVYLLCALGSFSMASAVKGSLIRRMLLDLVPVGAGVINPLLATLSSPMMRCAVVMLVLAIVFIAVFVVGRNFLKKREQRLQLQEEQMQSGVI